MSTITHRVCRRALTNELSVVAGVETVHVVDEPVLIPAIGEAGYEVAT